MDKTNHFHARIDVQLALIGKNYAWLAAQLNITPQGLRGIIKKGRPTPKTLSRFAYALCLEIPDLTKEVSELEYGQATIPRWEE